MIDNYIEAFEARFNKLLDSVPVQYLIPYVPRQKSFAVKAASINFSRSMKILTGEKVEHEEKKLVQLFFKWQLMLFHMELTVHVFTGMAIVLDKSKTMKHDPHTTGELEAVQKGQIKAYRKFISILVENEISPTRVQEAACEMCMCCHAFGPYFRTSSMINLFGRQEAYQRAVTKIIDIVRK